MELNSKVLGEGDPIIIMHGLFGMLDNWQSVAKLLAEEYMVILLDLRNHGKSPHSEEWSIELMAQDVRDFMEANWIHKATIMGHSMGGKVAMELALTEADLVDKLIVVDIGPKAYKPGHELIFQGLESVPIAEVSSRTEAEEYLAKSVDELGVRQFLLKNISRRKEGGYKWKMNLSSISENYNTIIEESKTNLEYDGPTLFIKGERSNYIMPDDMELIHKVFPKAELISIAGAGHWVHADNRDELVKQVMRFVAE
ncbi:alpha/beta fold hydrolase [Portibacter lacus]|uniref:Alpha/beta hydrolase n=1 Tax=Portibacter lacus TaxID=1099794 RepID=A0AA37SPS3_9BACT|nr:alpha/beta fold hydrolase [Portibacter lacus]GLR17770.1 alpha/beta hydrolase [Portibacter lacus]